MNIIEFQYLAECHSLQSSTINIISLEISYFVQDFKRISSMIFGRSFGAASKYRLAYWDLKHRQTVKLYLLWIFNCRFSKIPPFTLCPVRVHFHQKLNNLFFFFYFEATYNNSNAENKFVSSLKTLQINSTSLSVTFWIIRAF